MSFFVTIFDEVIFRPILNLLIAFVGIMPAHDLGLAIIAVTLLIRFALYPLSYKALKSQRKLNQLQPKIKEIQNKHKDDRQAQSQAVMEFYKKEGINPFSGCVPFLIQLPIIIGLYRVFLAKLGPDTLEKLYSFVSTPASINTNFIGVLEITEPSIIIGLFAGAAQFALSKVTFSKRQDSGAGSDKKGSFQNMMGTQMTYVLPFVTVIIAQTLPAGVILYWFITTLFNLGQQLIVNKKIG